MKGRDGLTAPEKRALLAGGSRGIGLATAKSLAGEGCLVALVARREATLTQAAREVVTSGQEALALVADVRRDDQVRAAVERRLQVGGNRHPGQCSCDARWA